MCNKTHFLLELSGFNYDLSRESEEETYTFAQGRLRSRRKNVPVRSRTVTHKRATQDVRESGECIMCGKA